jgi:hypothetical protein
MLQSAGRKRRADRRRIHARAKKLIIDWVCPPMAQVPPIEGERRLRKVAVFLAAFKLA